MRLSLMFKGSRFRFPPGLTSHWLTDEQQFLGSATHFLNEGTRGRSREAGASRVPERTALA
jgi:hypothetical protein